MNRLGSKLSSIAAFVAADLTDVLSLSMINSDWDFCFNRVIRRELNTDRIDRFTIADLSLDNPISFIVVITGCGPRDISCCYILFPKTLFLSTSNY